MFGLKDRARFMKKLAFLLESGIPFLQALHFVEDREENSKIKTCIRDIVARIHRGMPIHKSFRFPPLLVDECSIDLIEGGEATGTLSKNCMSISADLEIRLQNRNRLVSALVYPSVVVLGAFVLILTLLLFVFPKILPLLSSGVSTLPWSTRLLILASKTVEEKGVITLVLVTLFFFFGAMFFRRSTIFRKRIQQVIIKLPFISRVVRLTISRNFSKLISLFLECGYTLSESLHYAERLEKNLVYKEVYGELLSSIKKGERFSHSLRRYSMLFPKETASFVALGEESGNLSKTLRHLSRLFDEEIKEIEKRILTLLEPSLMLFLGVIVGFVALSLITPLYGLTTSLNQPMQ